MSDRLLIFDFDGVIADSEVLSNLILAEELTALGHPTSFDDAITHYMGKRWTDCVATIEARSAAVLPDNFAERIHDRFAARAAAEVDEVAGIRVFLDRTAGRSRCVASSSSPLWLTSCLDRFGLGHHFGENLFSAAVHVTRGKPHPDLFLHAAATMQADPARAIVIEDSPTGVMAGAAAGMTVIGFLGGSHIRDGHGDRLQDAGATHIARDFNEVDRIMATI